MDAERRRRYELAGWWLFAGGVVVFLIQGLVQGELLTVLGSLLFLAGIVAFLITVRR